MNKLAISGLILLLLTSCNNEIAQEQFIKLNDTEIIVGALGGEKTILISSNCEWTISEIPQWCIINKTAGSSTASLLITVLPNESYIKRNSKIEITNGTITQYLYIVQDGLTEKLIMDWFTFPVNSFSAVTYIAGSNNAERIYTFKCNKIFIKPAFREKVFLGNLVKTKLVTTSGLIDYKQYTYNPISVGAFVNGKAYVNIIEKPSKECLDGFAEDIIKILPKQNLSFNYNDSPIAFHSYRQLHLLGEGNLGINLEELISGYAYKDREMTKKIGLIYSYSNTLFNIVMDIPEKLIKEDIEDKEIFSNLSYINNIDYGRIGFLVIESDNEYAKVDIAVKKTMKGQTLSDEESHIINKIDAHYLSFDEKGELKMEAGKSNMINKYINNVSGGSIMPLSFSVNNYLFNSVDEIEFHLILR